MAGILPDLIKKHFMKKTMKNTILIACTSLIFAACGSHPQTGPEQTEPSSATPGTNSDSTNGTTPNNTMDTTGVLHDSAGIK